MEGLIRNTYYDPALGLSSAEKLYRKLKDHGVSRKDIQKFLNEQEGYQLHKKIKRVKHYYPVVSNYPFEIVQVDIADFSDTSSANNGYKYLLVFIDIMSRYAYVYPMKNKTSTIVNEIVNKFLQSVHNVKKIMSDNGSEFINKSYKSILQKYDIKPYYVDVNELKSRKLSTVDRFIRTLRSMINKYMSINNTTKYIDALPKIVENYNNTYHETIKSTPSNPDIKAINIGNMIKTMKANLEEQPYEIEEQVRYLKNPVTFAKGSLPTWSKSTHRITDKYIHSYKLDNGKTYEYYQLQSIPKVKTKKITVTRAKSNEPTIEQVKKVNKVKRTLATEGVDLGNITRTKRTRQPTDRYRV